MTPRRCLRCYRSRPEADLRQAGQAWYCAPRCEPTGKMVPCLRCGRLLPEADAVRDPAGAGHYHEDCAGPWCYSRQRHDALVALHQGDLVLGGGWWLQPQREHSGTARQICGGRVMAGLVRDKIAIRVRGRAILAPHLKEKSNG